MHFILNLINGFPLLGLHLFFLIAMHLTWMEIRLIVCRSFKSTEYDWKNNRKWMKFSLKFNRFHDNSIKFQVKFDFNVGRCYIFELCHGKWLKFRLITNRENQLSQTEFVAEVEPVLTEFLHSWNTNSTNTEAQNILGYK
jgi:hypothetical protein